MFDAPTPPANLPTGKEPEDMFDKVEPAQTPPRAAFQSGEPAPAPAAPAEIKPPLIASRKIILVGGIILGILVIVGGGYAAFRFVRKASLPAPASTETAVPSAAVEEAPTLSIPELPLPPALPEPEVVPAPAVPAVPVDSDSDGLSDEEEDATGTMSDNPDSDNDTLLDGEEVKTYQTDPMNPDTDGDTFLDGQEVKNGYNPKGEGKLFTVPAQS